MNAEEKQALIERCEEKIKELSKVQFGIMHKDKLDLLIYCQALAALSAQPVKLPPRRFMLTREDIDQDYEPCMAIAVEDAIAAIRAAGYEVQE